MYIHSAAIFVILVTYHIQSLHYCQYIINALLQARSAIVHMPGFKPSFHLHPHLFQSLIRKYLQRWNLFQGISGNFFKSSDEKELIVFFGNLIFGNCIFLCFVNEALFLSVEKARAAAVESFARWGGFNKAAKPCAPLQFFSPFLCPIFAHEKTGADSIKLWNPAYRYKCFSIPLPHIRTRKKWNKHGDVQGCQMVCFQTKNPKLGKFWRVLQLKMLLYFMDTWSILRFYVILYGHLV
jgi:hypothetical protein